MRKFLLASLMKHFVFFLAILVIFFSDIKQVKAVNINVIVDQDTYMSSANPNDTLDTMFSILQVGRLNNNFFQSMYGFDVSSITGSLAVNEVLVLNSMSVSVYHVSSDTIAPNNLGMALGNNDTWNAGTATWNNSANNFGSILDTQILSGPTWNSYRTWDVSAVDVTELADDYLTFYQVPNIEHVLHTFEDSEYVFGTNDAFLSIDYDIQTIIPEPSTIALLGIGLIGLGGIAARRRFKKQKQ